LRDLGPATPSTSATLVGVSDPPTRIGRLQWEPNHGVRRGFPSIHVVAIEPQPDLAESIRTNLANLVPSEQLEVFNVAVGTDEADMPLAIPIANRGAATLSFPPEEWFRHLHRHEMRHGTTHIVVKVVPAEWVLDRSRYGWPTIVKLDVEGYEHLVIRSMRAALQAGIPHAIVFEHHWGKVAHWSEIFRELTAAGYLLYAIRKTVWRTWLEPVSDPPSGATDYVGARACRLGPHNRNIAIPRRMKYL
jgi:FkbM family methyltransferase